MNVKQSRASFCMALGLLVIGSSGHVVAQEDTSFTSVPNIFKSGDVISAEQMNNNFAAIADAIAEIKAASETQGEVGPIGPAGIGIKDAGAFAGSVSTATSGGNFSLLPGAGGSTGYSAADAACKANFPGSHAEIDTLALWKSVVDGELPDGQYWAANETQVPVLSNGYAHTTSECEDWTTNARGTGYGTAGNGLEVSANGTGGKKVFFSINRCDIESSANIQIACYED